MLKSLSALRARASKALVDIVNAERTQLSAPPSHLPLLHFAGESALERWTLQSDVSIGGFSECSLTMATASTAVFSGTIALESDPVRQEKQTSDQGKHATRTGFCAMRTAVSSDGWPTLHDFHGLSLRVRPDTRSYILNVRADNILGDSRNEDLYQTPIQPFLPRRPLTAMSSEAEAEAEVDELVDVRIPWGAFSLTWRGHVQSTRPPTMNLDRLTHVGLLLADGADGPFRCELESVSVFRYDDDELVHDPLVREAMRLNVERGYDDVRDG